MNNIEGNNQGNGSEHVESLRLILEREQDRSYSTEEARELGESLLSFFEVLADEIEQPTSVVIGRQE